jgi:hypothetical protein
VCFSKFPENAHLLLYLEIQNFQHRATHFASFWIAQRVSRLLRLSHHDNLLRFLNSSLGYNVSRGLAGDLFEAIALDEVSRSLRDPNIRFRCRQLHPAGHTTPVVTNTMSAPLTLPSAASSPSPAFIATPAAAANSHLLPPISGHFPAHPPLTAQLAQLLEFKSLRDFLPASVVVPSGSLEHALSRFFFYICIFILALHAEPCLCFRPTG